jgi:hypothetical protein
MRAKRTHFSPLEPDQNKGRGANLSIRGHNFRKLKIYGCPAPPEDP